MSHISSMSQARRPGLQSAEDFGRNERAIKRAREEDLARIGSASGPNREETVYRDKHGRKLDMLTEYMRQQEGGDRSKERVEKAQYEWGKGSVQKQEAREAVEELEAVAAEPFARTADNPRLEKMRRETIHEDDPMAAYFREKSRKTSTSSSSSGRAVGKTGKPLYAGPNPTPNRFGLRPGYRWDAIDRSNGFEAKVLRKLNEKEAFNEERYKWSVADL
jgi:pre-mRNA-splicing factor CWC26